MPRTPSLPYEDFVTYVSATARVPKARVKAVLRATAGVIVTFTRQGARVQLPGFGVFYEKHSKARRIRFPNGELREIPEKYSVGFRAAKLLKGAAMDRGRRE